MRGIFNGNNMYSMIYGIYGFLMTILLQSPMVYSFAINTNKQLHQQQQQEDATTNQICRCEKYKHDGKPFVAFWNSPTIG